MAEYCQSHQSRRQFITRFAPACALTCMGCSNAFALALGSEDSDTQEKHSFEDETTLTYKKLFEFRFKRDFIPVFKAIAEDIGKEKVLRMLERASSLNNRRLGERLVKKFQSDSFHTFAEPFRNPRGVFKHANIYEIIEDSEKAFAIRISDCLTASVFREADAADLGHAAVCHADFALPEGFNPKIKLIRDKTLMEGHDHCNHRYVWTG